LSTIDYSIKSSTNFLSTPIFDLGFNPDNRSSTQRNLLREISIFHESINGRFGKRSDLFNLRETNELSRSEHLNKS